MTRSTSSSSSILIAHPLPIWRGGRPPCARTLNAPTVSREKGERRPLRIESLKNRPGVHRGSCQRDGHSCTAPSKSDWCIQTSSLRDRALLLSRPHPSNCGDPRAAAKLTLVYAFQTLSLATESYYRQAGYFRPLASARLSTVLEAEIAAPRAASYPCRNPESDPGNGS